MNTNQAPSAPDRGSELTEMLGPLLNEWAEAAGVLFVCRSYGQRTTDTVSRDDLLQLMRAVQAAERERIKARLLGMDDAAAGRHNYYAHAAWVLFDRKA